MTRLSVAKTSPLSPVADGPVSDCPVAVTAVTVMRKRVRLEGCFQDVSSSPKPTSSVAAAGKTVDSVRRLEVLTHDGRALDGFSAGDCRLIEGDSTAAAVRWSGGDIASARALAGEQQPVRLRFHLQSADLYAFWIG